MKKILSAILAVLLLSTFSSGVAFAESNFDGMPDNVKNVVKDNYWAELEYKSSNPIPKYLMTPEESSLKGIDFSTNDSSFFSNTGIRADRAGVLDVLGSDYMGTMLIPAYKMLADNPSLFDSDDVKKQFNMELYKAFNMDVKTNFPLDKNKDQFVYGDIAVNDDTQHDKVASLAKGSDVKLKFSLDTSNVKKILNAVLLWNHSANTGFNDDWKNAVYDSDIDFVFVLDLPKGVTVDDNTTYAFSGLEGFTVTHKLDKQRLVIHARKNRSKNLQTLKKAFETINKLNEVALTISKVKIEDSVETEKNLTITGYAYGAYDSVYGNNSDVITNRSMGKKKDSDYINRTYHMMAAMQNAAGRDSTADAKKPNLITYTFQVKKPAQSTVTFKDGDKTHATVKVETGKAIDTDALTNESMPADPMKAGYTFKEWNTKEDGKGTAFTGASVVNGDMTVYAIYTKDSVPTPDPTPNPPAPNPDPTPNPPTPTPDPVPNPPTPELKPNPQTPAPQPQPKKHIGVIPKTGESASFAGLLAAIGFSIAGLAILRKKKMMEENK